MALWVNPIREGYRPISINETFKMIDTMEG